MLFEILQYLNIFAYGADDKLVHEVHSGEILIRGGMLRGITLRDGIRFAIVGSALNDGVHEFGDVLEDEVFSGSVYFLRKNPAFDSLVSEIEAHCAKYGAESPYQSESFGGYSYSKTAAATDGWQGVFAKRLKRWRKA